MKIDNAKISSMKKTTINSNLEIEHFVTTAIHTIMKVMSNDRFAS